MFRWVLGAVLSQALLLQAAVRSGAEEPALSPEAARLAVGRALPLLAKAAEGHVAQRTCFACHNQALPILALTTAGERSLPLPAIDLQKQLAFVAAFLERNQEKYRQGHGQGGEVDTAGYALLTLERGGWKPDATTEAVVEYLLLYDKDRDHWHTLSRRPPSEVSHFTATYLALRALRHWGTPAQKARITGRIDAARGWLTRTPGRNTEDQVFRLLALREADADQRTRQDATAELLRTQQADGGWAQMPSMATDAYATGSALVALQWAEGLSTADAAYQRGVAYLLRTQQEDGSWRVASHSQPFQVYFETGFPHGKDQFISAAASGWAATALALVCPPARQARR
jgi:hypothetical protein